MYSNRSVITNKDITTEASDQNIINLEFCFMSKGGTVYIERDIEERLFYRMISHRRAPPTRRNILYTDFSLVE